MIRLLCFGAEATFPLDDEACPLAPLAAEAIPALCEDLFLLAFGIVVDFLVWFLFFLVCQTIWRDIL